MHDLCSSVVFTFRGTFRYTMWYLRLPGRIRTRQNSLKVERYHSSATISKKTETSLLSKCVDDHMFAHLDVKISEPISLDGR